MYRSHVQGHMPPCTMYAMSWRSSVTHASPLSLPRMHAGEYPAAYPSDWELLRAGLLRVLLACPGWGVLRALMNMLDQFNATKAQFNKVRAQD